MHCDGKKAENLQITRCKVSVSKYFDNIRKTLKYVNAFSAATEALLSYRSICEFNRRAFRSRKFHKDPHN